jgi:translocation and assembly module TamB
MRKLAALLLVLVALAAAGFSLRGTGAAIADEAESTVLGDLISRILSTPGSRVQVGAVDGALSSDATIRNVTITDKDGTWLKLDRARLIWTRTALFSGKLAVDKLEIGKLEILRPPAPSDETPPPPADAKAEPGKADPAAPAPLLPELPVRVEVKEFALSELALGEPLLGEAARLSAKGKAKLGPPAEGLDASFETTRLDRPGKIDLRLLFVPTGEKLALKLDVAEPEGGLIARLANLPGLPPVDLEVSGEGKLDAFAAKVQLVAGSTIGVNGDVTLRREQGGRRLDIDLSTRVEGLLPAPAQPLFAGGALAQGTVRLRDDGAMQFEHVGLESDVARLEIDGAVSAARIADLRVVGRALEPKTNAARSDVRIETLVFDTTIKGPVAAPTLAAALDLKRARTSDVAVETATARIDLAPVPPAPGASADAKPSFDLTLRADMDGLKLADPAFARAVGDRATIDGAARIAPDGVADVSRLKLDSPALDARFKGRVGPREMAGRLDLVLADLSRFADVTGMKLKGEARGGVDLSGDPSRRLDAQAHLLLSRLATGIAPLDRLTGGKVTLDGLIGKLATGGFVFQNLVAKGAHLDARLDGQIDPKQALVDIAAAVTDLRQFDGRMTGRADLTGRITGTLEKPDATAVIVMPKGTAMGRPVEDLKLTVQAKDLAGSPQVDVTLDGAVGGKPAKGGLKASKDGDTLRVENLDLAVGSVTAKGAVVAQNGLYDGQIALKARDLDDVAALALTPLDGDLDATIQLRAEKGQTVAIKASSQRLRADKITLDGLLADLVVRDALGKPVVSGAARLARATQAGKELASNIRFNAAPDGMMTLAGRAQGFDIDGAGRLIQSPDANRLELSKLDARKGRERIALAQPGAVVLADGRVDLDRIVLALGSGRLALDGRVSPTLDLTANARAVPLSVAEIAAPGLGLQGTLDAQAKIAGSPDAPEGDWRVAIKGLSAPATRSNGLPPLQLDANGRLGGGRATLDATLAGPRVGPIRATGSVPVDGEGALDLRVTGKVDLALANAQLGASGRRVAGFADIDARVMGPASKPQVQGGATLNGVSFTDAESGMKLTDLRGRIAGGTDELRLEGVQGRTPNGGSIAVSGKIALGANMPAAIKVTAQNAQLMDSNVATAVADAALDVTGPLAGGPLVSGRINFTRLDVTIPERMPASARPLDKVKHVNAPPQVARRVAAKAKAARATKKAAPPVRLDLRVTAPNRVFVRGRGVDAELGGELTIRGAASHPAVVGGFELRRGKFSIGGRRLDFTRGRVIFSGTLEPQLDFLATQQASDALIQASLSGSAAEPDFKFFSDPDLPQDEVLARLLFGKSSGGLTAAQGIQLAMIAAQFSGSGDGGALDRMRRQLGLDSLDVGVGAGGGVGVGVNKAINDRISIGAKAGAKPEDTGVSVDVDLTRRLRLKGEATMDGNTGVGLGYEMEY